MKRIPWAIAVGVLLFAAGRSNAQGPPGTEIFVAPLRIENGAIAIGAPLNVTSRTGYDNQPSFTPDGRDILYTSIRADGQADIYEYEIASGATTRVTRTGESEYSPTVMPGDSTISVVRVERDSTQRLWSFDRKGDDPRLLLDRLKPVGYHAWSDAGHVALFILGEPHRLQFADLTTGLSDTLARNIGRSLHRIPGGNAISFVQKISDTEWWIMKLDPATHAMTRVVMTLPGVEDYAWTPDGRLVAAKDKTLFECRPGSSPEWTPLPTPPFPGVTALSRISVSPSGDRIAIVGLEPTSP